MKNKIIIKESYLLIIIIIGILSLCMYSSFALFSLEKTSKKDIVTMSAANNIETTLKIYEYKEIKVPAGESTSLMVNVNNDTGSSIYYGVFYEMISPSTKTDNITIAKIDWSTNATSGSITNGSKLPVELIIINNSSSEITLNIGVAGSDSNELGLTDGKTLITETFNTGTEPSGDAGETKTTTTDYSYTGSVQTVTLKAGTHKLEVWGAQGGGIQNNSSLDTANGGKGGYSYGTLTLTSNTNVYIYVGGMGKSIGSGLAEGGFNGGGAAYGSSTSEPANGGGGASDIRINEDSLYSRVIVAGGGGGGGEDSGDVPGYGGGTSGGASSGMSTLATQTGTGTGGTFGFGANTPNDGGGGGGGWYGGGTTNGSQTIPTSNSGSDTSGGAGGSGYVYTSSTASNYPSGVKLNSSYYLTNASTIAGNQSFTDNTGSTVTGHSGNGYARITSTVKASTVPSIDTSSITINEGDNIDLKSKVTCKDNGAGCKIVLVKPSNTKGLTKSTTALYVLEDNNGNRYKYKKQVNIKENFAKLIMSLSKGDSWDANAEDGVYYTNSHEYRYIGAEPNNYVWFNNDMYQAIGVFDENSHGVSGQNLVKLIMANPLGGYSLGVYNSSNTSGTYSSYRNDWTGNTTGVKANLNVLFNEYFANRTNTSSTYGACANWTYFYYGNTDYRTNDCSDIVGYGLTSSALNSIETTTWYLYGSGSSQSKQNWYLCERGGNSCTSAHFGSYSTTTSAKIGLMYLSDYLYASGYYSSSDTTTNSVYYYGNKNWLYKGYEWLLTPYASSSNTSWRVSNGNAASDNPSSPHSARPTFYLKSTVSVTGGDGTFDNPYIIE